MCDTERGQSVIQKWKSKTPHVGQGQRTAAYGKPHAEGLAYHVPAEYSQELYTKDILNKQ